MKADAAMTPKKRAEQLKRIYEEGGAEALSKFTDRLAETNPVEYIEAMEAVYILEGDDEELEEFQAKLSRNIQQSLDDHLSKDGFAGFDEMIRLAREQGEDEAADKIEAYLKRLRH